GGDPGLARVVRYRDLAVHRITQVLQLGLRRVAGSQGLADVNQVGRILLAADLVLDHGVRRVDAGDRPGFSVDIDLLLSIGAHDLAGRAGPARTRHRAADVAQPDPEQVEAEDDDESDAGDPGDQSEFHHRVWAP